MSAAVAPKYRADAKGCIKELIAEFRDICANQIRHADFFVTELDDLDESLLAEYSNTLTRDEMTRAFRTAMRRAL